MHYRSRWVRADAGGILFARVKLGQKVAVGDLLGSVTDPITNLRADIVSPYDMRAIEGSGISSCIQALLPFIGIQTRSDDLGPVPSSKVQQDDDERDDVDPESRDGLEDS